MDKSIKESKLSFTLDKLMIDPRTGAITVDYTVPNVGGPTQTKQGLLYAGYRLIWAAMSVNPTTQYYTLHGYAYPAGSRQVSLALFADVTADKADAARGASDYTTVASYLSYPWWRPDLAGAPL